MKQKLIILFITLTFFLLFPKFALAVDYYVAITGNDTSPGTLSQPWKTIQKAADTMVAGDTVTVNAGNYPERVQVTTSGSTGLPITYQAAGTVVMQGFTVRKSYREPTNYITIRGFEITDTSDNWVHGVGVFVWGRNNIIENNYIHYATRGGILLFVDLANTDPALSDPTITSNCVVRNNRLERNSQNGVTVNGRNNLIEGNEVWDSIQYHPQSSTISGADADGMRFFGQGHIFRNNYIHDIKYGPLGMNAAIGDYNDTPHIDCFQTWTSTYAETAHNILFEQNFCDNAQSNARNENGSGFMIEGTPGQLGLTHPSNLIIKNNVVRAYGGINARDVVNLQVYNNILSGDLSLTTAYWPMAIGLGNVQYPIIKNNIIYDQNYHTINIPNSPTVSNTYSDADIDYNAFYNSDGSTPDCIRINSYACRPRTANEIWNLNPLFVNPATKDFHLQIVSPLIDKGLTILSVTNDFDGIPRPQGAGYDIGAFEFEWPIISVTLTPTRTTTLTRTPTPIPPTPTRTPTPTNPVPTPTPLPGDIDGSGRVGVIDLNILLSAFGFTSGFNPRADLDNSGAIGVIDLNILLARFGR